MSETVTTVERACDVLNAVEYLGLNEWNPDDWPKKSWPGATATAAIRIANEIIARAEAVMRLVGKSGPANTGPATKALVDALSHATRAWDGGDGTLMYADGRAVNKAPVQMVRDAAEEIGLVEDEAR